MSSMLFEYELQPTFHEALWITWPMRIGLGLLALYALYVWSIWPAA